MGALSLSAISRIDAVGVKATGLDVEFGHYGKSSLSAGVGKYSIGAESNTFESFDGTAYERSNSVPEIGRSIGFDVGFVIAIHASASISFSGVYNSFVDYGEEREWWK